MLLLRGTSFLILFVIAIFYINRSFEQKKLLEKISALTKDEMIEFNKLIHDFGVKVKDALKILEAGRDILESFENEKKLDELGIKYHKKYYIVNNRYSQGKEYRLFWGTEYCGHTVDLNKAGVYYENELLTSGHDFPEINKDNIKDWGKYDDFIIATHDIELLGRKMECILN